MQTKRWLKAATLTTAVNAMKVLLGLFMLKLIASRLGPSGLGRLGHFMSIVSVAIAFAGGGMSTGVIKYVAEFKYKPRRLLDFI